MDSIALHFRHGCGGPAQRERESGRARATSALHQSSLPLQAGLGLFMKSRTGCVKALLDLAPPPTSPPGLCCIRAKNSKGVEDFHLKVKATTWPQSGLDCLVCAGFVAIGGRSLSHMLGAYAGCRIKNGELLDCLTCACLRCDCLTCAMLTVVPSCSIAFHFRHDFEDFAQVPEPCTLQPAPTT
jgi:hypothetical protein